MLVLNGLLELVEFGVIDYDWVLVYDVVCLGIMLELICMFVVMLKDDLVGGIVVLLVVDMFKCVLVGGDVIVCMELCDVLW